MLKRLFVVTSLLLWAGAPALAQIPVAAGLAITLDEVERRALERNPAVAEARLATDAADYTVAESRTAYTPNLTIGINQRSQTNPSTSQLAGGQSQVTNNATNYSTGIAQQLPWFGARYSVDFNSNRSATSNVFSTFNPSYTSGFTATVTQPLLQGFKIDPARAQIQVADLNRSIADVQLRQETDIMLHSVRRAYWELVYAVDALETAKRSEDLARRNLADNKLRVELGTLASIDVVQSEAEIASRHQATVQAEGAWRNAQVNLKELIVKDTSDPIWTATLLPVERPAADRAEIDVAAAIANATANRTDLQIARRQQQSSDVTLRLANDQRRPAVDLTLNYGASGVGGTQILRGDVLGSSATGAIPGGYFDALSSLAGMNYPTWSLGLNVTMPMGKKAADAAYARGVVERRQADMRLESLQLRAAADVTRAAQAIRSAEEVVEAAAAARQLAERRLQAETARRDAGLSTTFLVLQAQRDLATAETAELRARLDYRTALADFDRVQTAP